MAEEVITFVGPTAASAKLDKLLARPGMVERVAEIREQMATVDRAYAQSLVAIYRRAPLRAALDRLPDRGHGCSMGQLLAGLTLTPVADAGGHGTDADTWDDVATLEARIRNDDADQRIARDPGSSRAADGAEGLTTR